MTRKAKKLNSFSQKIMLFGVSVFVLLVLVAFGTWAFRPKAELIVMVAPSKVTIRLDGKKIQNGARKIRAGKHTLELSLDGLEPKKQEFEISTQETKSINLYLTGENEDFSYYLNDEKDIELLSTIADEKAAEFISDYYKAKNITELLPLRIVKDYGEVSSELTLGKDCTRSYCLKITDSGAVLKDEMLSKIKALGYNPEDYEIQYELVDGDDED